MKIQYYLNKKTYLNLYKTKVDYNMKRQQVDTDSRRQRERRTLHISLINKYKSHSNLAQYQSYNR